MLFANMDCVCIKVNINLMSMSLDINMIGRQAVCNLASASHQMTRQLKFQSTTAGELNTHSSAEIPKLLRTL